jgi:hypothetical protein
MGSGSQSGKEFEVVICQNGKWQSQWQTILSGGVLKWEVAVKGVDSFNCWYVKMGSSSQSGKEFEVVVCQNGKQGSKATHTFNYCCVEMVSGSHSGRQF